MRYRSSLLLALSLSFSPFSLAGYLWQSVEPQQQAKSISKASHHRFAANLSGLEQLLLAAPTAQGSATPVTLDLPLPDGSVIAVDIVRSPVLSGELQQKYPHIHTFKATSHDNPAIRGRLDLTRNGFHGLLKTPDGMVFINPEQEYNNTAEATVYRSLKKADESTTFSCQLKDSTDTVASSSESVTSADTTSTLSYKTVGEQLRTYRLALAATNEYRSTVNNNNISAVYSAMVTAINRVNQVLEKDTGVFLQLVSGEDLISTSSSDYTNTDSIAMLTENQTRIDNLFGSANYDIGHLFSTYNGGVARLSSTCRDGNKAEGVTGSSNPQTDVFYIDYVAHEIGHQLGATHTFNADGNYSSAGDCAGNRESYYASAYEVGSGSTIMAYAGLCSEQNLQNFSDDYYHGRSIEQIRTFIETGNGASCGSDSSTGDIPPVADAGDDFTIPASTPFVLTGAATDSDSDETAITYTWEQYDLGAATTNEEEMHTDLGSGPLMRSWPGSTDNKRYIPTLSAILSGDLSANTGERLPTTDRTLNFLLTVRSGTSGVDQDSMQITVDKDSGPFTVTTPADTAAFSGMNVVDVNWAVANTDQAPVNCNAVNILLSTDAGDHFDTALVEATDNNGSASVQLPNLTTTEGKIEVRCSDNIFFNVSPGTFSITSTDQYVEISGAPSTSEGDSGSTALTFTVTLGTTPANNISVDYQVSGSGTHPADADDFGGSLPTGTLYFTAGGSLSQNLAISITGDSLYETDETFTVTLSNPINATLGQPVATGTLVNDDPGIEITATTDTVTEGTADNGIFSFLVTRVGSSAGTASVDYAVIPGASNPVSADDFADGSFPAGTVSFADGESSKTVEIAIAADGTVESNETFTIQFSNAIHATLATTALDVTVINDDKTSSKSSSGSSNLLLLLLLAAACLWRRPRKVNGWQ